MSMQWNFKNSYLKKLLGILNTDDLNLVERFTPSNKKQLHKCVIYSHRVLARHRQCVTAMSQKVVRVKKL